MTSKYQFAFRNYPQTDKFLQDARKLTAQLAASKKKNQIKIKIKKSTILIFVSINYTKMRSHGHPNLSSVFNMFLILLGSQSPWFSYGLCAS